MRVVELVIWVIAILAVSHSLAVEAKSTTTTKKLTTLSTKSTTTTTTKSTTTTKTTTKTTNKSTTTTKSTTKSTTTTKPTTSTKSTTTTKSRTTIRTSTSTTTTKSSATTRATTRPTTTPLSCVNGAVIGGKCVCSSGWSGMACEFPSKKNLLFVVVDDLRPQLKSFGEDYMKTPNFDQFASESMVFQRAFSQGTICSPSRASFLSGRRPDNFKQWAHVGNWPELPADSTFLPLLFRKNGYYTASAGKIFHGTPKEKGMWHEYLRNEPENCPDGADWCAWDESIEPLVDTVHSEAVIKYLSKAVALQPFMVAFGINKPHTPFAFPKRLENLYPEINPKYLPPSQVRLKPKNSPAIAYMPCKAIHIPTTPAEKLQAIESLRRAYYTCVSYADDLFGKILQHLDDLNLRNSTLIVLTGDHGFHLGEQGTWCKHTNFENAARVPLMISVPWKPESKGVKSNEFVELLDLMPTLRDLLNLEIASFKMDGKSLAPIFDGASLNSLQAGHQVVRYENLTNAFINANPTNFTHLGYSLRVDGARYTQWMKFDSNTKTTLWDERSYEEYYEFESPSSFIYETENLAGNPLYAVK